MTNNHEQRETTMILSFSGSDIRNSTEEELRESMRQQIQEQTDNQQQKERVQPCTNNQ